MQTEITLGQVAERLFMLEIGCRKCDRYGRLQVARLTAEHGAGQGLNGLLTMLSADCPRQSAQSPYDRCGAYFPQLPAIFG
jgi:hypothetical protein